jgi:hypothetical protein
MTFFHSSSRSSPKRTGLRWAWLAILLAFLPLTSWAGGVNGEEVTSLPVVSDTSGVTFVGGLPELRALAFQINGAGRIDVRRVERQLFAVTFVGDYRISLDRAALARSNVQVLFTGGAAFQGGTALLTVADSDPQSVPAERVPLPLSRLAAAPRVTGMLVDLQVFGLRTQRAHIGADFGRSRVTLFQRTSL